LLLSGADLERQLASCRYSEALRQRIIRRRGTGAETREPAVRRGEARRLAQAIRDAGRDLKANAKQSRQIVDELAPGMLTKDGIGPVSAAQAIVSWSHSGRCRNHAAFAALAGAAPIPASSGQVLPWRLRRGGDRQLNHAPHTIAMTRWRGCPRTAEDIARRRTEGKADGQIRRILNRYIARELYRTLNTAAAT
jgi:transposase